MSSSDDLKTLDVFRNMRFTPRQSSRVFTQLEEELSSQQKQYLDSCVELYDPVGFANKFFAVIKREIGSSETEGETVCNRNPSTPSAAFRQLKACMRGSLKLFFNHLVPSVLDQIESSDPIVRYLKIVIALEMLRRKAAVSRPAVHALLELTNNPWSDCNGFLKCYDSTLTKEPCTATLAASSPETFPASRLLQFENALRQKLADGTISPLQACASLLENTATVHQVVEKCACLLECLALLLQALKQGQSTAEQFALKEVMFKVAYYMLNILLSSRIGSYALTYFSRHCFAMLREAAKLVGNPSDAERLVRILQFAKVGHDGHVSAFGYPPLIGLSKTVEVLEKIESQLLSELRRSDNPFTQSCFFIHVQVRIRAPSQLALNEKTPHELLSQVLSIEEVSMKNMEALLTSAYLKIPDDGWVTPNLLLDFTGCGNTYGEIQRVSFNKKTKTITIYSKPGKLVSDLDVATGILFNGPGQTDCMAKPEIELTLNPIDGSPLLRLDCSHLDSLNGTPFLYTLFNADYMMKQFFLGFENSRMMPFSRRELQVGQGLFDGLPEDLCHSLRPISERGEIDARPNVIWMEASRLEMKILETDDLMDFIFGKVDLQVKTKVNFTGTDGTRQAEDPAAQEFSADMTSSLDRLAQYYPEFARVNEITKLMQLSRILSCTRKATGSPCQWETTLRSKYDAHLLDKRYRISKCQLVPVIRAAKSTQHGFFSRQGGVYLRPEIEPNFPTALVASLPQVASISTSLCSNLQTKATQVAKSINPAFIAMSAAPLALAALAGTASETLKARREQRDRELRHSNRGARRAGHGARSRSAANHTARRNPWRSSLRAGDAGHPLAPFNEQSCAASDPTSPRSNGNHSTEGSKTQRDGTGHSDASRPGDRSGRRGDGHRQDAFVVGSGDSAHCETWTDSSDEDSAADGECEVEVESAESLPHRTEGSLVCEVSEGHCEPISVTFSGSAGPALLKVE